MSDTLDLAPEDILDTIEQVEETLTAMTDVIAQIKEHMLEQMGLTEYVELTPEEFLERCENISGTLH